MKLLVCVLIFIFSAGLNAKENDWTLRAEIETMRTVDRVWLNNQGEFYWATSFFSNAMPCKTKLEQTETDELSQLIQSLPTIPYERKFNNQCKDGLRFFIFASTELADGSLIEVGKKFPNSKHCRKLPVDKSWDDLSLKLHELTQDKFKSCRQIMWK
ncbi:hypothetical protein [Pseudoalteromonas arctica]|uniref:Uncharacterized protein n=1 Tax=Pseudoalteromonas arctica TaxID=394751 RepID=A0ABU9TLN8_9GAMM